MQITFKGKKKSKLSFPKWLGFLKDINSTFYYYLFLVLIGVFFFSTSLFTNYFTTPFTGDYTAQQFAFYTNGYDDWWHFFRTGEFVLYDTNTFLGASNIGSNSFYYLFDPFFMPILLFPREIIPQGIAILTIFKMALAGLVFHYYLRYIGISKNTARLSGLAYAFCGWTTWYLWFNHFTGVAVSFPLILLGVEKVLKEKKPWLLSLSIFLLGLTNFFFFFTFTLCAFLYAMFRYLQKVFKRNAKDNLMILLWGFVGFLAGVMLSAVVVIPSMMVALNAPRATNSTYLPSLLNAFKDNDWEQFFRIIFNWESQGTAYKVYYPILDFIFPVMSDRGTPLTKLGNESYDNVAGSLFCYSPFIIFLVPALIASVRKKQFSHLIATAMFALMLFTPFFYFAFHGFTMAYSRWTLFVTTSLITYVSFYIDKIKEQPKWDLIVGSVFATACIWVAVFLAIHIKDNYDNFKLRYQYSELGELGFLLIEGIAANLYVFVICIVVYFIRSKKSLQQVLSFFVAAEAILMGTLTLFGHGYENYMNVNNGYENNVVFQSVIDRIKEDDPTYYRCYSSQENSSARNDSMRHGYNGLGMFHSIFNYNIAGFLNWSQINDGEAPGSWSASYVEKRQNLDTFLGIKYYIVHKDKAFWGNSKAVALKSENYRVNAPLGFKDITSKYPNSTYYIYENENFIDLGFSFDKAATYESTGDNKDKEPTRITDQTFYSEELYLNSAIMNVDKLNYLNNKIPEENIFEVKNYKAFNTKKLNKFYDYNVKYYDIHGDIESGRTDSSSAGFADQLLDLSAYPFSTTIPSKSKYNGRYVSVITTGESFPYDPNGMVLYLKNPYKDEYDINIYLVTKDADGNERFLTFDNHNDSHFGINSVSRKLYRGVYSSPTYDEDGSKIDAPRISKIIICNRKTEIYNYELYYQSGTSVFDNFNELNKNPLQEVHYSTNHFDFKTNFSSPRVVVTRLPYEDGWKIKAKDNNGKEKELEVFTAQGGFVSFLADEGEYSYSLDFYTPYLKTSSLISIGGQLILFGTLLSYYSYCLYMIYYENRKKYGIYRENMQKPNVFSKEVWKYYF